MKKLCISLLCALCLITSCNTESNGYARKRLSPLERAVQEYSNNTSNRRVRPTERDYLGSNTQKQYVLDKEEQGNYSNINYSDNSHNFIDDNGAYSGSYKIGKPYKINDVTYHPQQYDNFEEVGVASWYGDAFHGRKTANGEIYYKTDMTAAHPTLPLPSIVKITNLTNGKFVKVRVNDRGPFSKKRIVDVSEKAAQDLGFKDKGTAVVKLEFLREDTDQMLANLGIVR
jgi:rare lipoprotein A (peptidoglycan hydrolase)